MSLQYMVRERVCMKGHPSLVHPISSNLHGLLLGSIFVLESFFFLGLEDDDLLAEVDVVAVLTMMTSRLLDGVF